MDEQPTTERLVGDEDWSDILATLKGEQDAYARLISRYRRQIIAQMWRFADDCQALEELVQDVLVEVYLSLSGFKGRGHFGNWLRCVASRVGYRHWKSQTDARRDKDKALEWYAQFETHQCAPWISEAAERLSSLMKELPPEDRLVLSLKYFRELTTREIAERVGWSETLVRVRAYRARSKLRGLLGSYATSEGPRAPKK